MTWTLLRHLLDLPDSSRFVVLKSASFEGGSTHRLQCVGALSRIANDLFNPQVLPELTFSRLDNSLSVRLPLTMCGSVQKDCQLKRSLRFDSVSAECGSTNY